MIVVLACRGNPDFGQDPNRTLPGVRARRQKVATLREASEACRAYISNHDLGGGNWTGGDVFDADGKQIAHVSYNGRVWRPGPYPQPEIFDCRYCVAGCVDSYEINDAGKCAACGGTGIHPEDDDPDADLDPNDPERESLERTS